MAIYFTSDTHFGHANIINLCERPFASCKEMEEAIVDNWNSVVGERDEVWHLGDFAYKESPGDLEKLFKRLKGRKRLVIGNHDSDGVKALPWQDVQLLARIKFFGRKVVLFHYPIEEWQGYHGGTVHFHGHQHNKRPFTSKVGHPLRLDVGVDANDFKPQRLEDLLELGDEKGITNG